MWRHILYSNMQKVGCWWQDVGGGQGVCRSVGFRSITPLVTDHETCNNKNFYFTYYFMTLVNFTQMPQPTLLTLKYCPFVDLTSCYWVVFLCVCQVGKLLMENAQLALQSDSMKSRAAAIQARSAGFGCSFPENSNTPLPQSVRSRSYWSVYRHKIPCHKHTLICPAYVKSHQVQWYKFRFLAFNWQQEILTKY